MVIMMEVQSSIEDWSTSENIYKPLDHKKEIV